MIVLRPWKRKSILPLTTVVTLVAAVLVFLSDVEPSYMELAANSGGPFSTLDNLWPMTLSLLTLVSLATAFALSWLVTLQMGFRAPIAVLFAVLVFSRFLVPSGLDAIGLNSVWVSETALAFVVIFIGYVYCRRNPDAFASARRLCAQRLARAFIHKMPKHTQECTGILQRIMGLACVRQTEMPR